MNHKVWAVMFACLLLGALLVPRARADEDNQAVKFTTNGPIEVPGRVLAAGRYEIKLSASGSPVAGLWNARGTRFYGYFETIPIDRSHKISRSELDLSKTFANDPERLKDWFYPGDTTGHELLYPVSSRLSEAANCRQTNQG
ncbi:MAG TPA: hypothetical protein VMT28_03305 [Terriglobales bacterium]|jgi:hypothetical protein|nr:hypothetical protein [Terriglobales bacterium]